MAQEKKLIRSRLPPSEKSKILVPMRLLVDEYSILTLLADKESRSKSAMARLIFIEGLKLFDRK